MTPVSSPAPLLSIVIATYNAAATLERCLQSIISQTLGIWEIIIADGGSTDKTNEIIRRYERHVAYWHSHSDAGIYDAWNQALEHVRGDYICFLGSDDSWSDSHAVQSLFDAIGEHDYDIVSGKGRMVDAEGNSLATIGRPWSFNGQRRRMLICHPSAFHRRSLFDRLGKFDTKYRIAADYDWMLRLPAATRALFVDRVVVDIQDGGISRTQRRRTINEYWMIQARSPRVGRARATLTYLDRTWRHALARLLQIYY